MPDVAKLFFRLVVVFATVLCSNAKRPNTARATTVPVLHFVLTSDNKKKGWNVILGNDTSLCDYLLTILLPVTVLEMCPTLYI